MEKENTRMNMKDLKEVEYITDMIKSIENDRQKYEPERRKIKYIEEMDVCDQREDVYEKYVEKEYMYFRNIDQHYCRKYLDSKALYTKDAS